MTNPTPMPPIPEDRASDEGGHSGHRGHSGWAMVLCCIPMVIAFAFIIFGR